MIGGNELVQHVRMLPVGVEGHVPRARSGGNRRDRDLVRAQRAGGEIEIQHVDLVGAEVDTKHVLPIEVGEDLVRVRAFLAGGLGPVPLPTLWNSSVMAPSEPRRRIAKDREVAVCS